MPSKVDGSRKTRLSNRPSSAANSLFIEDILTNRSSTIGSSLTAAPVGFTCGPSRRNSEHPRSSSSDFIA